MSLRTPYVLPFRVIYQAELATGGCDVAIRILPVGAVSAEVAETFDATVLPFMLMATSGALAGGRIQPWTSTVGEWSKPQMQGSAIEWLLTSVTVDLQAWVMLAQMLLVDHKQYAIERIEFVDPRHSYKMLDVSRAESGFDPYPKRWAGIRFPVDFYKDLPRNFTVGATFSRHISVTEQEGITEELFTWAPGLMNGAYGVPPLAPDRCTGMPDENVVFVDNELEWPIRNFKAHSGAIEGLINVLASVSQKIVPVMEVRIE